MRGEETLLWVRVIRRCGHLEIAGRAIIYTDGKGQNMILSREQGDVLRVVGKAGNRAANRFLTVQEASTLIPLNWFRIRAVSQACAARGWAARYRSSRLAAVKECQGSTAPVAV